MGRHDVAMALEAMEDDEVRAALVAGDLSALGEGVELTAEERDMVVAAAADHPEVVGHGRYGIRAGQGTSIRVGQQGGSAFDVARIYAAGTPGVQPWRLR